MITGSQLKLKLQGQNLKLIEKKFGAFLEQICSTRISTYKVYKVSQKRFFLINFTKD